MIGRSKLLAAALVAATLAGTSAGVASATSRPSRATSGTEHIWVGNFSPKTGSPTALVANGLFTDAGALSKGTVTLSKGGFLVNRSHLKQNFKLDAKTCLITATFGGSIEVSSGTGAYKGISGTLSISGAAEGVLPRLKNGKCDLANNAVPIETIGVIRGSGKVTL